MFTIGDFATFTQVSVPALRLWDRRGLLRPAYVDPRTGYRFYKAEQVIAVHRVQAYKALGFTLTQISGLLTSPPASAELSGMLALRRAEADAERRRSEARIAAIEARLRILERNPHMSYEVTRKSAPAVLLAAISQRIDAAEDTPERLYQVFGALFGELSAELGRAGVDPTGPAWSLYDRSDDAGIVVAAALPVAEAVDSAGRVTFIQRPETDVASTVHLGDVIELGSAYAAIMSWLEASHLTPAGGAAEISLVWDPRSPESNVTELQIAIATSRGDS
ncbi:DNA-binding transcriptional MerR regulator [Microbacterium sp. SLBN-154]|uniref:MerR family transcriptional regulator n=1 Tax=Microbacterium sp. SLBN-154 TaxID=2768458 RepID=UPI001166C455|nr:MerR family transcriptional regulator [Microbacterium sp. SLBN-154]TQK17680.1 DNA-binding transcriptional MerR regulator [Microbacterium sp. SLBN-154]